MVEQRPYNAIDLLGMACIAIGALFFISASSISQPDIFPSSVDS